MKKKLVAMLMCGTVALTPMTAFADEDYDALKAEYDQLKEDYETLQSEYETLQSEYEEYAEYINSLFSGDWSEGETEETAELKDGDVGEGEVYIQTVGGTSEDGNVPVIYADDDTDVDWCDVVTVEMDGSMLTYLYVDDTLTNKEQMGDYSMASIELRDDLLSVGEHEVKIVQYEDNDEDGEIIFSRTASYEVKSK